MHEDPVRADAVPTGSSDVLPAARDSDGADPDTIRVATVGGRVITRAHVEARVAELRRGPRARHIPPDGSADSMWIRRWVVQELVARAVLEHEASDWVGAEDRHAAEDVAAAEQAPPAEDVPATADVPGPEDVPAADAPTASFEALAGRLFDRVTSGVTVTDAEIAAFHAGNPELFRQPETRRVRHVLLADEAEAQSVTGRAQAGEDLAALAAERSVDSGTRSRGGDLGEVRRGELAGQLETAIFAADVGRIVGPVRTAHGWHVARIEAITPERCVPLEEARAAIEVRLLAAARNRAFEAFLDHRRDALAVIEPAWAHPGDPVHGLPRHRH